MNRLLLPLIVLCLFLLAGAAHAGTTDYLLGEGDILKITVYDNPDLTTTARVSSGGTIVFPLLGEVQVGGLTVAEVGSKLAKKLADGYLLNPQVMVFIQEFRSKKATIMGEVVAPGLYELSGTTTLLEMISKARGLVPNAGDVVTIKRKTDDGKDQILNFNLKDLMEHGKGMQDIPIQDGDNIFVNKAGMFYVTGQVRRPDAYKYEQSLSVIKAVTRAGGFTDLAATGRVRIIRRVDGRERVIDRVSLQDPVQAEDVIVVPESYF